MLKYKVDILSELNQRGITSYRIRKENLFGESAMTRIRNKEMVSTKTLDQLCRLLSMQPGDIIEFTEE